MTSTSEFVSNENSRRKILEKIREQNVPNSQLFQEFLVEYELLAEYRLLQVKITKKKILKKICIFRKMDRILVFT